MAYFKPNITNYDDLIVYQCDTTYETWLEVLKYVLQAVYLIPGGVLNALLLFTFWRKNVAIYGQNSFFIIYSLDCLVSFILILTDVFVGRLFLYFTPICPLLAEYFYGPLVFFKFIMIVINHSKICKSIIQVLLVVNRMTCVLWPLHYGPIWKKAMKIVIPVTFLLPICTDWNLAISRVYMQPTFGGFYMEYIKQVSWASQSRFQLVFIITALGFTLICTSATLYTLIMLPQRLKDIEKTISVATVFTSIGFVSVAVFQVLFAFFSYIFTTNAVFGFYHLSYDFLNVGSPLIMIIISKTLRSHVFFQKSSDSQNSKVFSQRRRQETTRSGIN